MRGFYSATTEKRHSRAFTLLELMTTLAIASILTSISFSLGSQLYMNAQFAQVKAALQDGLSIARAEAMQRCASTVVEIVQTSEANPSVTVVVASGQSSKTVYWSSQGRYGATLQVDGGPQGTVAVTTVGYFLPNGQFSSDFLLPENGGAANISALAYKTTRFDVVQTSSGANVDVRTLTQFGVLSALQ